MKKLLLMALVAVGACGDRPAIYDTDVNTGIQSYALADRVAVIDSAANRALMLVPTAGQGLSRSFLPIGKQAVQAQVSPDGKTLFVLSAGDVPRNKKNSEKASLSVITAAGARRFELETPHSSITLDPLGRYVALFTSNAAANPITSSLGNAFVANPNEIVILDLQATDPAQALTSRTLRSFGGKPVRVTFSQPLNLPGGSRRLLLVETDQDVHLLDLDNLHANPPRTEITVPLTSGTSTTALHPQGLVVDDGEPAANDDARIGIRVDSADVFTLTLVGATSGPADIAGQVTNDFRPEVNLTDVGGTPGDIVFVRTDLGLRLAAVVPQSSSVVLFDPTTSITTNVPVNGAFSKISLVTNVVSAGSGSDTALLYGGGGGVAFLSLGKAVGQTYRTVDVVSLGASVSTIQDIPPPRPELKVLEGGTSEFFVLNLQSRTASPLETTAAAKLHVASDGGRIWAYSQGSTDLAEVTLDNLHPVPLTLDRPISAVYDVARADGGRALVALDLRGTAGATVLDATNPDTTNSRSYYGLFLEGL